MSYLYLEKPTFGDSSFGVFSGSRSAEDPVYEGGLQSVLRILGGPSPWRPYILANLEILKKHRPNSSFRIVPLREFTDIMSRLGHTNVRNIPGFTDKRTGAITMQEWGVNSKATFLGAALHEAVHLVSHPAEQGSPLSTAHNVLGEGILEGLVECVTIDILNEQKITLAKKEMRGHQLRLPVAVALVRTLSIPLMARVLFEGNSGQFEAVMHHTYSVNGWHEIKNATTANKPELAFQLMSKWRASQQNVHRIRLNQQRMQIPGRKP